MLPVTPKTLFFLLLLFGNLFVSRAGKWQDCKSTLFGSDMIRGFQHLCYAFSTEQVSYMDAKSLCTTLETGGLLAEPPTLEAAKQLTAWALAERRDAWIGVTKDPIKSWTFNSNRDWMPYSYKLVWGPTQPSGDGDCAHLWFRDGYRWNDVSCRDKRQFICQKEREWLECSPNPCQNNGKCEDIKGTFDTYTCNCVTGTRGQNCSEDINECDSSPCDAGGTCDQTLTSNYYFCHCKVDTPGINCQYKLPDKPEHDCEPYVFVGENLACTCWTKNYGNPRATVGFVLAKDEYTPTLFRADIATAQNGLEFVCGLYWHAPGIDDVRVEKRYTLNVAYGPTDRDTVITGPRKLLTDGESDLTVTLTCSSFRAFPDPIVVWEGVICDGGNHFPECRYTPNDGATEITSHCTLKNPIRQTAVGRANHTLKIDASKQSVIAIKVLRIGGNESPQAAAGQSMQLVCEAFGGDPRPVFLEVYHTPGVQELGEATNGTKLTGGEVALPQRSLRKTYSVKSPDICGSTDAYRCDAMSNLNGQVISKHIGLYSNCSAKAPEASDKAPVAPIVVGAAGFSLFGLLVAALLLWKRRKQAEGTANLELDAPPITQEEDAIFLDRRSGSAQIEKSTDSSLSQEGDDEQSGEKSQASG